QGVLWQHPPHPNRGKAGKPYLRRIPPAGGLFYPALWPIPRAGPPGRTLRPLPFLPPRVGGPAPVRPPAAPPSPPLNRRPPPKIPMEKRSGKPERFSMGQAVPFSHRSNALWIAFTARSESSRATSTEILISLVEIIWMFTWASERASNIFE